MNNLIYAPSAYSAKRLNESGFHLGDKKTYLRNDWKGYLLPCDKWNDDLVS